MNDTTGTPARPKFEVKKKLTLPTFKFVVDSPFYALFLGPIHRGTQRGKPKLRADGTPEEPPMLAHVVNMETGEHGQIMVAEIIKTEITENFPKDGYVGHGFAITKQKRKEGKRYDPYNIDEVDVPEELQAEVKKYAKIPVAGAAPGAVATGDESPTTGGEANVTAESQETAATEADRGPKEDVSGAPRGAGGRRR